MVTTKDVAKEAGVSQGTVSNVLNKTGKVSSEKIARVEEACRKLGYKANAQAQRLKMGSAMSISLILPSLSQKKYFPFFENLRSELTEGGISLSLHITEDLPSSEKTCLEKIYEERPSLIITCSSLGKALLYEEDMPVLFLDRFAPDRKEKHYNIGFSFYESGKEIGRYLEKKGYRNTALLVPSLSLYDFNHFLLGLNETYSSSYTLFKSDQRHIVGKAMQLLYESEEYDSILVSDYDRALALKAANTYLGKTLPETIVLSDSSVFDDSSLTLYRMDYGKLGKMAGKMAVRYIQKGEGLSDLALSSDGFPKRPELKKFPSSSLRMLTINSPATTALMYLLPDFEKKTGIRVTIDSLPYNEVYEVVKDSERAKEYDLIRVDMAWLGEVAPKLFRKLDSSSPIYKEITSRFLPEIGRDYFDKGDTSYTLPFDPSVQLLFYNKDVFDNSMTKRQYFERYKESLTIPSTFAEYDRIARFFTRSETPTSPTLYGHSVTCGAQIAAASDFLPRIIGNGDRTLSEILKDKRTLSALNDYAVSQSFTSGVINTWWDSTISSFINGETAMLIVYMNHASQMTNSKYSKIVGNIGFAQVPGKHPLLGGGAIGIEKDSTRLKEAVEFFRWIYSDEIAKLFTFFGGLSPNRAVYDSPEILSIYPWISSAKESFKNGRRRLCPEKGGYSQRRIEEIIGKAVQKAALGTMSAEKALEEAALEWEE